jgi:hypothetical protein
VHPVEAAWRKFRNSEHLDLFERSFKLRQSFLDSIGLKRCPPEVALPLGVPWNLAGLAGARKGGKPIGTRLGASNAMLVNTIHVWAAYREAKHIYEFVPTLAACLARSPWPEETPAQALRLPSRCPVLVIPRPESDPSYVAAVYDLLTGEENSGALELRISEFMKAAQWWVPICVLHLNHDRLAECLDAAAAEAERHGAPAGEAETVWRSHLDHVAVPRRRARSGAGRPSRREATQGQNRTHRPRTVPRSRRADRPVRGQSVHTRYRAVGN